MMILPWEILLYIINYAEDLLGMRLVCKFFRDYLPIKNSTCTNLWYKNNIICRITNIRNVTVVLVFHDWGDSSRIVYVNGKIDNVVIWNNAKMHYTNGVLTSYKSDKSDKSDKCIRFKHPKAFAVSAVNQITKCIFEHPTHNCPKLL